MNINNLLEKVPDGFFEIPDFDGMYHINKYGDVYSVRCNKILKWQKNQQGYCFVNLTKNKSVKLNLIHRLVAKTFILNPKNLPEVNHIDGIKSNNSIDNLEWVTRSQNIIHGIKMGLIPNTMINRLGSKHWKSKPVLQFDSFGKMQRFEGVRDASRKTGYERSSIQDACNGKIKTYKGYRWEYEVVALNTN